MSLKKWTLAIAATGWAVRALSNRHRARQAPSGSAVGLPDLHASMDDDDTSPDTATARIADLGRTSQPAALSAGMVGSEGTGIGRM